MLYKKNLEALMKKNPRLAQLVDNAKITGRYVVAPSQRKDKLPSLIDVKYNKNFYNNIDPYRVAEQDIKSRKLRVPDLAVFLGFGLSYEVYEYIRQCPRARVLIIEQDPELLKVAFSTVNCLDLLNSQNIHFVGCEDIRASYPIMFKFFNLSSSLYFLKAVNIIEQPISFNANKEYYLNALKVVKDAIHQVLLLYGNDPHDSLLGIKFTLRNIPTIISYPGIADLENVFKGKPGIVVASGPSIDKNVKLLEGLREKAVICAADGSVKILKHHNLPPAHLVTSLERVIATSHLFDGLTEEDVKDSYLAACPVVVPETYANFPGEKVIVYRNFSTFEWLDIKKGILDIGPSAGNMAFKILEYLGCDPIIMEEHIHIAKPNKPNIAITAIIWIEIIPETVGQYTGLTDENGKKIFEGDIINDIDYGFMKCTYWRGSFVWYKQDGFQIESMRYVPVIEIIGNIHDNPELLEVHNG